MTEIEKAAERMIVFVPPEIAGGNGAVYIGPHDSEEQGWELRTIRDDFGLAERCVVALRRLLVSAITSHARPAEGDPRLSLMWSVGCGDTTLCAMLREDDAKAMALDLSEQSGLVTWVRNHSTPATDAARRGA